MTTAGTSVLRIGVRSMPDHRSKLLFRVDDIFELAPTVLVDSALTTTARGYLARAAELESIAGRAADPVAQAEWQSMAASYKKIAEMVEERNSEGAKQPVADGV